MMVLPRISKLVFTKVDKVSFGLLTTGFFCTFYFSEFIGLCKILAYNLFGEIICKLKNIDDLKTKQKKILNIFTLMKTNEENLVMIWQWILILFYQIS